LELDRRRPRLPQIVQGAELYLPQIALDGRDEGIRSPAQCVDQARVSPLEDRMTVRLQDKPRSRSPLCLRGVEARQEPLDPVELLVVAHRGEEKVRRGVPDGIDYFQREAHVRPDPRFGPRIGFDAVEESSREVDCGVPSVQEIGAEGPGLEGHGRSVPTDGEVGLEVVVCPRDGIEELRGWETAAEAPLTPSRLQSGVLRTNVVAAPSCSKKLSR